MERMIFWHFKTTVRKALPAKLISNRSDLKLHWLSKTVQQFCSIKLQRIPLQVFLVKSSLSKIGVRIKYLLIGPIVVKNTPVASHDYLYIQQAFMPQASIYIWFCYKTETQGMISLSRFLKQFNWWCPSVCLSTFSLKFLVEAKSQHW